MNTPARASARTSARTPARTPAEISTALPITADPQPPTAKERAQCRRIADSADFGQLLARLRLEADPSPALLTAALAWVAHPEHRIGIFRLPSTVPWCAALTAALGPKVWTVTMDAWFAVYTQDASSTPPAPLRRVATRWGQCFTSPTLLRGAVSSALRSPHHLWIEALLRHAPAWTADTVQQMLAAAGPPRAVHLLLLNRHISPDAWRAIEESLAFQPLVEGQDRAALAHLLSTVWSTRGASVDTQQRAARVLEHANTLPPEWLLHLGGDTEMLPLIAGGHLPWSACAPWAATVTSPSVMSLLLHHPDLPGSVAARWLARHPENTILRRTTAEHPTLGAHPGVRRLLWPHLPFSPDLQSMFLRHGTGDEARAAFEVLAVRTPLRALTLLATHRPPTGFAVSHETLHRLLAHREAEVRLATVASLDVLRGDSAVISVAPTTPTIPVPRRCERPSSRP